jgi:anti-sigma-K factor RskA
MLQVVAKRHSRLDEDCCLHRRIRCLIAVLSVVASAMAVLYQAQSRTHPHVAPLAYQAFDEASLAGAQYSLPRFISTDKHFGAK